MAQAKPRREKGFLPTQAEIRARAAAIRDGLDPDEINIAPEEDLSHPDDWRAYEQERDTLAAIDEIDKAEWRSDAAQRKLHGQSAILRDMCSGVSQRAASANAGAPVRPGKDTPHYLAYNVRLWVKRLMIRGLSDPQIAAHFGVDDCRGALPHLAVVREGLRRECKRWFCTYAWTTGQVFRHFFKGDSDPDKAATFQDCEAELKRLKREAGKSSGVLEVRQAKVVKMAEGKKPWRVCDQHGVPIRLRDDKPIDRGGYEHQQSAQEHARAINESIARRKKKPLTRAQKRAPRKAEIARKRAAKG